jgi:hypothetical protein
MENNFEEFIELPAIVNEVTKVKPKGLTSNYSPEDEFPTFEVRFSANGEKLVYTLPEHAFKRLFPAGTASAVGKPFSIRICNLDPDCPLKLYCLYGMRVGKESFTRQPDCQY